MMNVCERYTFGRLIGDGPQCYADKHLYNNIGALKGSRTTGPYQTWTTQVLDQVLDFHGPANTSYEEFCDFDKPK